MAYFTDKELVIRAARAAGYRWKPIPNGHQPINRLNRIDRIPEREETECVALWLLRTDDSFLNTYWNPLEQIDQAMELLFRINLKLEVNATSELMSDRYAKVFYGSDLEFTCSTFSDYNSAEHAVCRAILRAIANKSERDET